jgi:hypothetical protein
MKGAAFSLSREAEEGRGGDATSLGNEAAMDTHFFGRSLHPRLFPAILDGSSIEKRDSGTDVQHILQTRPRSAALDKVRQYVYLNIQRNQEINQNQPGTALGALRRMR